MVLYLRYLFFEFIEEHKEKSYTKEFDINIGNLLPEKYETDSGGILNN